MRQLTFLVLVMVFSIFRADPANAASLAPVAMITDVQGSAWLVEDGKQSRLGLMTYLSTGASLRLDAGARIAVVYFSIPREFAVSGPALAIVETERLRSANGAVPVARNLDQNKISAGQQFSARQRERQAVATFEMKAFAPDALQLYQPVDTRLLGAPEEFSWRALSDAQAYRVQISDSRGKLLHTEDTTGSTLRLPKSIHLKAGETYTWTVKAQGTTGDVRSAQASFSLLDAAMAKRIEKYRPTENSGFSERLLYASMLENAGLKLAAQAIWKQLATERPDDEMLRELSTH